MNIPPYLGRGAPLRSPCLSSLSSSLLLSCLLRGRSTFSRCSGFSSLSGLGSFFDLLGACLSNLGDALVGIGEQGEVFRQFDIGCMEDIVNRGQWYDIDFDIL